MSISTTELRGMRILQVSMAVVVAWVGSVFGALFLGVLSVVGAPLSAGVVIAAVVPRTRTAAIVTAAVVGSATYTAEYLVSSRLIVHAAVDSSALMRPGPALAVLASVCLGALAGALAAASARPRAEIAPDALAIVTLLAIIAGTLSAAASMDPGEVNRRAEPGSYSYDAAIYLQTHRLMVERDIGYYDALVEAASGDSRLIEQGSVVDGKFVSWATSGAYVRLPFIFWVWKAAASIGLDAFALAMILMAALMAGMYRALKPMLGQMAVAVPLTLSPWFIMHTTRINLFFPDLWAAMFALGSMLLALRQKWLAAGALALAAALCREVAAVWLVFLLFGAVVAAVSDRERAAWRDVAIYAALFGALLVAVFAHRVPVGARIAEGVVALPVADMLAWSAKRSVSDKFLLPGAYLMYLYGAPIIPTAVLSLLAPWGFLRVIRGLPRRTVATLMAAAVFWPAFTLTIGATSDYWGQHYTAFALVGSVALALSFSGAMPARPSLTTPTDSPTKMLG